MTIEEWADKLCIALSEAYATGGITAKRIIIPILESALAERTEQCAKIVEQGNFHLDRPGYSLICIAKQIRALNQPENKS